jgi:hemoglobin-like flavoprotein
MKSAPRQFRSRTLPKSRFRPRKTKSPAQCGSRRFSEARIQLLRQTFALLEPHAGIAGLIFYKNLFRLDPSLRQLFQTSIELQARKLMEALGYAISTLEQPAELIPALEAMGRRHVAYGVRDEHYATVIQAMLLTVEEILVRDFTPLVRAAWNETLTFVADTMKRGAAQSASHGTLA